MTLNDLTLDLTLDLDTGTSLHTPLTHTVLGKGESWDEVDVMDSSRILLDLQRAATSLKDESLLISAGLSQLLLLKEEFDFSV